MPRSCTASYHAISVIKAFRWELAQTTWPETQKPRGIMRPTDKATAESRSVQSFAIIKNTGHENFVFGRFHTRARNGLTGLCTVAPCPRDTPSPIFFWGEGAAVHRLSEMDNRSSNCPSKLMDKVRRIVHSKLKLFHFQIKAYYLIIIKRITRLTRIIRLYCKNGHFCYKECCVPAWVGRSRVCFFFYTKIIFKLTIDISMCKIISEVEYF